MGRIEAVRHKVGGIQGKRHPQSTGAGHKEGTSAVVSQVSGAVLRAFLVALVVALPSMMLPDITSDTKQLVALFALLTGAMVFAEYNAEFPTVTEFRDAPPFNRIRFGILFGTVAGLSLVQTAELNPSSLAELVHVVGRLIGTAMDFPYSPVRLVTLTLASGASDQQVAAVRDAAGLAYLTSLIGLSVFVIIMRFGAWPVRSRPFNVWINLPTFDPSASGDVVARLERDGRVNVALGLLLPFIIPFVVTLSTSGLNAETVTSSQTLIWIVTAWSFLPASLIMRGIAIGRIAEMIREARRANDQEHGQRLATA